MTLAHIGAVASLEEISFPDDPWPLEAFLAELSNDFSRPLVAWDDDGNLVGYLINWMAGPEVHIANIAVDPNHRGKGFGRAMMERAISQARESEAEEMILEVRVGNTPAVNLYLSLGFKKIYVRQAYYRNGEDAVIMSLPL